MFWIWNLIFLFYFDKSHNDNILFFFLLRKKTDLGHIDSFLI